MPAEEELSPEEKLLKVIQDAPENDGDVGKTTDVEKGDVQGTTDAKRATDAGKTPAVEKATDVEKGDVQGTDVEDGGDDVVAAELAPATVHAPATVAKSKLAPGTTIRTVNRVIGAALALLLVGLVWEIFAARPDMPKTPDGGTAPSDNTIVPLDHVGVYVAAVTNRDLFLPYGQVPNDGLPQRPVDESFKKIASYVAKNVRLSGVSKSDDPAESFAVIADQNRKSMRYPRVGDTLNVEVADGVEIPLEVKAIHLNRVILLFKGRKGEKTLILKGKR